jgi:hypothetical protein
MTAKQYRVLLIVPDAGLGVLPEVDSMFDLGYSPQVVQGTVTRDRIFQIIRARSFDIIHYAGHAGPGGIQLSDGILDGPSLVQIAKSVNATLIFLNGCETIELGQTLVDEHVPIVICTLRSVADSMARETSQLFYRAYAQTGDARAAYNMSKPPVKGGYSILTNGASDISLAPVLEKLAEFSVFMQRNDVEHHDLVKSIDDNRHERQAQLDTLMRVFKKSRVWSIVVMLTGMVGIAFIFGLFSILSR